jgi:uncharacterized membrane protein
MKVSAQSLATAAVLLLLVDLPWLFVSSPYVQTMIQKIQGSALEMRYFTAIPVYIALAYLIHLAEKPMDAFWIGASTYAVYDFTNLSTLKNYSFNFALVDTLWGGVLFAITRTILNML